MENYEDIVYTVVLNEKRIDEPAWFKSKIHNNFQGKLMIWTLNTFWFELVEDGALVAIPYEWIKCLAPIKEKKEEKNGQL
jgi:hypothetical protein